MVIGQPQIVIFAGLLCVLAAIAYPALGLALFAAMTPMREPEVFVPVGFNFVLSAATLAGCILRLPIERPRINLGVGAVLAVGYLALSAVTLPSIVSGSPEPPFNSAVNQYLQFSGGMLLFVSGYIVFQRLDPIPFLALGLMSAAITAILAIIILQAGTNDLPVRDVIGPGPWVPRAVGTFSNSNYYGLFLSLAILLGIGSISAIRSHVRYVLVPVLGLLAVTMLLSFSRGAVLTLLAGLVTLAFARSARLGLMIVLASIVLAAAALPIFLTARLDVTSPGGVGAYEGLSASDEGRRAVFDAGVRLFEQDPVFGTGFGLFPYASAAFLIAPGSTYPHNSAIKVLAEQGIVGGIVVVSLVFLLMRAILRSRHPLRGTALAVLVGYGVGSLFLEPYVSIQTSGLTWLVFAAVLAPVGTSATDANDQRRAT